MSFCPITLDPISDGIVYSQKGLRKLSNTLTTLGPLEYSQSELLIEASARVEKMSIQGVQPKLSAVLKVKDGRFQIVNTKGRFILKPCPPHFADVPANESLTMTMAKESGIDIPNHGLVFAVDGSLTFWIKRFDREGRSNSKLPQEDFAQLLGKSRDTKYEGSMEKVAKMIEKYCSFPVLEKRKLAKRTIFCFVTGNEDMHLKNFSLVTRREKGQPKIKLSPAYDLLNTTIVLGDAKEEMALPINGKKRNLTRNDLLKYYCREHCGVSSKFVDELLSNLSSLIPRFHELINRSYLGEDKRKEYREIFDDRAKRLEIL